MKFFVIHFLCMFFCFTALAVPQGYLKNNTFYNWESAHVHPLAVTPNKKTLLAVNTANASLEIFEIAGANIRLRSSIHVGLDPITVRARSDQEAWVVNTISDTVSVVDLSSGMIVRTLAVDDEPADVVFAGVPQKAFVSCAQAKTVMVFDPANLDANPLRIPINGEQPRAMAVSPDQRQVYLAIFESGNQTTAVTGGKKSRWEEDLVRRQDGPYGGVDVPGGSDGSIGPAMNSKLPAPPPVSVIVRRKEVRGAVQWVDDSGRDWAMFVSGGRGGLGTPAEKIMGWDLVDRDVAIIDTTSLKVTYQTQLMNILMAMAVNPATGEVTVVGTDALNEVRWEPNLRGTFLRVNLARFKPGKKGADVRDLNSHLDYKVRNIPASERIQAIGDPRGITWDEEGSFGLVTGMGSNNLVMIGTEGERLGAPITVGQGPTGVVLIGHRAFVLNRFDATVASVDLVRRGVASQTKLSFDPTPYEIKSGRPILYNTTARSGLGHVACASCHVDTRWDRLAWDLGNPTGEMLVYPEMKTPVSFHPMKGPLLTQTLIDTMQSPFLHWRGDKKGLDDFSAAFKDLQGAERVANPQEIALLKGFLENTRVPPNPYRSLDNSFPTRVEIRGPNNTIARVGNAVKGAQEFERDCRSCHPGHTLRGSDFHRVDAFGEGQLRNAPTWRNFYKRIGLWFDRPDSSTVGFGFQQDGTFDSKHNGSRTDDMMAFMYSVNGSFPYEPTGLNATNYSNDTHAAVGKQVTLRKGVAPDDLLPQLMELSEGGAIALIAKGRVQKVQRGYLYAGNKIFQSDRLEERVQLTDLVQAVEQGGSVTFTAVPAETAVRMAIDMDMDGVLDFDEKLAKTSRRNPDRVQRNLGRTASSSASSILDADHAASKAADLNTLGYLSQKSSAVTAKELSPYWEMDLRSEKTVSLIQVFKTPFPTAEAKEISIFISTNPLIGKSIQELRNLPGVTEIKMANAFAVFSQFPLRQRARHIRIQQTGTVEQSLDLAEVRVIGSDD